MYGLPQFQQLTRRRDEQQVQASPAELNVQQGSYERE
jgi:hypothetical protein